MQQRKKKFMKYCKLEKTFDTFGEGMYEILQFKPNMINILFPDKEITSPEDITKEEFYNEFPNVISKFNPITKDSNGKYCNILWEFHLAHSKFHIKTNNYFAIGMQEIEDGFIFYITLFGNFDIDKEYLLLENWKEQQNTFKKKEDNISSSEESVGE